MIYATFFHAGNKKQGFSVENNAQLRFVVCLCIDLLIKNVKMLVVCEQDIEFFDKKTI